MAADSKPVRHSYLKAWVAFWLVSVIGGVISAFVVGGVAGLALGMNGWSAEQTKTLFSGPIANVLAFVVLTVASFIAYRWSVWNFVLKPFEANRFPKPDSAATDV